MQDRRPPLEVFVGRAAELARVAEVVTRPRFVGGPEARAVVCRAFGPAERAMFRVLGIRQYLLLHRAAS
jgi:hypothetical protein